MLLAQFLVLGFTIYVWWAARRDLALRGARMSGPAMEEWERLQDAVQTLIADLERRATAAEQRVAAAEQRMADAEKRRDVSDVSPREGWDAAPAEPKAPLTESPCLETEQAAHGERYAPVYALVAAGVTDVAEIVRRTGLGHGEVTLILGLRGRQPPR